MTPALPRSFPPRATRMINQIFLAEYSARLAKRRIERATFQHFTLPIATLRAVWRNSASKPGASCYHSAESGFYRVRGSLMHNADTQRLLQRRRTGEPSGLPRAHHRRAQPDRHPASNGNAEDARTSAHVDRQAALDPNLNDRLAIGRNASAALLRACHAVISGVPALRRHARDTGAGTPG